MAEEIVNELINMDAAVSEEFRLDQSDNWDVVKPVRGVKIYDPNDME